MPTVPLNFQVWTKPNGLKTTIHCKICPRKFLNVLHLRKSYFVAKSKDWVKFCFPSAESYLTIPLDRDNFVQFSFSSGLTLSHHFKEMARILPNKSCCFEEKWSWKIGKNGH